MTRWLLSELPGAARAWLPRQRWFGSKARAIEAVAVEDLLWLALEPSACAVVVLDLTYAPGLPGQPDHERYATLLGVVDDPRGCPVIGQLPGAPELHVVEAADSDAVHALLRGLTRATPVLGIRGGRITAADTTSRVAEILSGAPALPAIVPLGVEQSNTSVRVGAAFVFKLFRRLEAGDNPQIEIGRALAQRGFLGAPQLEGSLTYRAPDGQDSALGALERWLPNTGDGWRHVVSELQRSLTDCSAIEALTRDLTVLGRTTAQFHGALAGASYGVAFEPEPITSADLRAWEADVRAQTDRAMALVEQHHQTWPAEAAGLGAALLRARPALAARLRLGLEADGVCQKVRVHGDYHLGQTLKTADGFAIIDFEGEPAKPLAQRRRKHCVLKDVAGMLRSLDYAAQTAGAADPPVTTRLRRAFTDGYAAGAAAHETTLLPAAPEIAAGWSAFFEIEKALYEVEYEVNNRPAWVHIPLQALARLLDAGR